jgi:hypothetical protein
MLMLVLPLVFIDLAPDRVSVAENRMLAGYPSLVDLKNRPEAFIQQFDIWFKDSTGFRDQILALYHVIDKNKWINRVTQYQDGPYIYLIGEKGHRYFAGGNGYLIPKFQGKEFIHVEQLHNMANKLEDAKIYLDSKGIPLVVMLCTDKETIYPEFYPKSIKRGSEPNQLEVITTYLQNYTNVDIFNIRQALLARKNDYLLYNISSGDVTHYNGIGSFFAYRELMNHIITYLPKMIPYEIVDTEISYDKKGIPSVSLKEESIYIKRSPLYSFDDDDDLSWPFPSANFTYDNSNLDLPTILFFCDSNASDGFIGKFFAQHFGKIIFLHYGNLGLFEKYIVKYKPDIVVFESAERALPDIAFWLGLINFGDIGNSIIAKSRLKSNLNTITELPLPKDIGTLKWTSYDMLSVDVIEDDIVLHCGNIDPHLNIYFHSSLDRHSGDPFIEITYTNSEVGYLMVLFDYGNGLENDTGLQYIEANLEETTIILPIEGWQEGKQLVAIRIDPPDNTVFIIKNVKFLSTK